MKKIIFIFLISILFFPQLKISLAQSDNNEIEKNIDIKNINTYREKMLLRQSAFKLEQYEFPKKNEQEILDPVIEKKKVSRIELKNIESTNRQNQNTSSNLVVNGNFELGYGGWSQLYKNSDGNWYNWDDIIGSGDGYGNWGAYMGESEWLKSSFFDGSFWKNGTCSNGNNFVETYIYDETASEILSILNIHNASSDNSDYQFYKYSFDIDDGFQNRTGHKFSLNFIGIGDDPDCMFSLEFDDISITAEASDNCIQNKCKAHRFWSNTKQGHFFTKSETEANSIIANDSSWSYEGIAYSTFSSSTEGSTPIYRFWSASKQHHFFTKSASEKANIEANDPSWQYEGIAYYAYATSQSNSTPIYRFWSNAKQGHFFTKSATEKNNIIANDSSWSYEGIAWYVPNN